MANVSAKTADMVSHEQIAGDSVLTCCGVEKRRGAKGLLLMEDAFKPKEKDGDLAHYDDRYQNRCQ